MFILYQWNTSVGTVSSLHTESLKILCHYLLQMKEPHHGLPILK